MNRLRRFPLHSQAFFTVFKLKEIFNWITFKDIFDLKSDSSAAI